jgi:hypothetical protein
VEFGPDVNGTMTDRRVTRRWEIIGGVVARVNHMAVDGRDLGVSRIAIVALSVAAILSRLGVGGFAAARGFRLLELILRGGVSAP